MKLVMVANLAGWPKEGYVILLAKSRSAQLVGSMTDDTLLQLSSNRYSSGFGVVTGDPGRVKARSVNHRPPCHVHVTNARVSDFSAIERNLIYLKEIIKEQVVLQLTQLAAKLLLRKGVSDRTVIFLKAKISDTYTIRS